MSVTRVTRRKAAVKVADTLNRIEGIPVTDKARQLSDKWVQGQITGEEMKAALLAMHKRA